MTLYEEVLPLNLNTLKFKKMKKVIAIIKVAVLFLATYSTVFAQRDILYKKDSTGIRCKILKETTSRYKFAYVDSSSKVFKTSILKLLVDSVQYNFYDTNLVQHKLFAEKRQPHAEDIVSGQKNWVKTIGIGLNVGNILEFNPPSGNDKKSFSGTVSLDAGLNYAKESSHFAMTNELHWLFSLQKSGLTNAAHIQRVSDNVSTLHDFSIAIGKTKKWNFNLIARFNTSVFNIYNGDYFKDINSLGKIQGCLSPYDITISPGIKWHPNKYLRISISPYSFNLYGVKSQQISNTGIFITDTDASGNYKRNVFKRLGAEINFWYDRRIKKWLELQYRFGVSSNYFEKIARNGLVDGLLITKVKIIKNVYLSHRAVIKANLTSINFKPYYSQVILLSYSKSF